MSMRNYGIFHQGAVFFHEDFDPAKVITAVLEVIIETTVPDHIKTALAGNDFSAGVVSELCGLLDMSNYSRDGFKSYSDISNSLVAQAGPEEWFDRPKPLMGTDDVGVFIFSDIEGEYVFDTERKESQQQDNCFIFSLDFPLVWRIGDYTGPKSRNEVIELIREAARPLLRDDIDWDERLGALIGSSCG